MKLIRTESRSVLILINVPCRSLLDKHWTCERDSDEVVLEYLLPIGLDECDSSDKRNYLF